LATPYSDVFAVFTNKISDYDFADKDVGDLEEIFIGYLKSSIVRFRVCQQDLSDRNDVTQEFNENLTEEEVEILANLMIVEWLNPRIQTTLLIAQSLSSRDARMYSQAAQLREVITLRDKAKTEAQQLMSAYSYSGDLSDLP